MYKCLDIHRVETSGILGNGGIADPWKLLVSSEGS